MKAAFLNVKRQSSHPVSGTVKKVLSRIMRKLVCRLWLDEVSQQ